MYRLNLIVLGDIAREIENGVYHPCLMDWLHTWIFDDSLDYGADIPILNYDTFVPTSDEEFDRIFEGFTAIDDIDYSKMEDLINDVMCDNKTYDGLDIYTFTEVSDKPGIKFCLKDENRMCHEECYADDEFCEMVVFLGYPEDKVKYPNAYPIWG